MNNITDHKRDYGVGLIGIPGTMNIEWRQPTEPELEEIVQAMSISASK